MSEVTDQLSKTINTKGIINALAIDQRGALKRMIESFQDTPARVEQIEEFKQLVSEELTPYASAILLDPEFGIPAAKKRSNNSGLLLSYEQTGYDTSSSDRYPDLIEDMSVYRLKELGANATKFLIYYDADGDVDINNKKQAFVERVGSESHANGLPLYLEIVVYDQSGKLSKIEAASAKPQKVLKAMKEFSKPQYMVDILKVEVPLNMDYFEGYNNDNPIIWSLSEAKELFAQQSNITNLPFIFLSAGVSADLFKETLKLAAKGGSTFNGVLCGRATWADGVQEYIKKGADAARLWLQTVGRDNITSLTAVLEKTATPIK